MKHVHGYNTRGRSLMHRILGFLCKKKYFLTPGTHEHQKSFFSLGVGEMEGRGKKRSHSRVAVAANRCSDGRLGSERCDESGRGDVNHYRLTRTLERIDDSFV